MDLMSMCKCFFFVNRCSKLVTNIFYSDDKSINQHVPMSNFNPILRRFKITLLHWIIDEFQSIKQIYSEHFHCQNSIKH